MTTMNKVQANRQLTEGQNTRRHKHGQQRSFSILTYFSLCWCCILLVKPSYAMTTIRVDQDCYDSSGVGILDGREDVPSSINVSFDGIISPEGVWIGLYEAQTMMPSPGDNVAIGRSNTLTLPTLPSLEDPSKPLKQWILTCGETDDCENWVSTGQVTLTALHHPTGAYVVVISGGARQQLQTQAVSAPFLIINERMGETCAAAANKSGFGNGVITGGGGLQFPTLPPIANTFSTVSPTAPTSFAPTEFPTLSPTPLPTTAQPTSSPTPAPISFIIDDPNANGIINQAWANIRRLIEGNRDLMGMFLRLAFHDCVGGCDGCVDLTDPDNNGLDFPIQQLDFAMSGLPPGQTLITRADMWMMAAMMASEIATPPDQRPNIDYTGIGNFHWFGRPTCEMKAQAEGRTTCGTDFNGNIASCTARTGPHVPLCHGSIGTSGMLEFFDQAFGWNAQQVTAIMGAHSVGRMNRQNSGHTGTWDLSPHSLDMGYWIELAAGPEFQLQRIPNSDIPGMPDRLQWVALLGDPNANVRMLNSDIALVRNIPEADEVQCGFFECDQNTPFASHVQRYINDFTTFLFEYRDVLNLMVDFGHTRPAQCPGGRFCSFAGSVGVTGTSADALSLSTNPDTNPSLTLDKACYTPGFDTRTTITFNGLVPPADGVWIGIYRRQDIPQDDFTRLPAFQSNSLIKWILTCGRTDTCDTTGWRTQGTVSLFISDLSNGDYMAVASGEGGSTSGQAGVSFQIGGC